MAGRDVSALLEALRAHGSSVERPLGLAHPDMVLSQDPAAPGAERSVITAWTRRRGAQVSACFWASVGERLADAPWPVVPEAAAEDPP